MQQGKWPIVLLDGGLGTTLTEAPYNFHFDDTTPLWSSHLLHSHPSHLRDLHAAFADAGAEILLTATYQSSEEGFKRTLGSGSGQDQAVLLMNIATRLAQNGLDMAPHKPENRTWDAGFRTPCLALSLGPLGATLVPSQEYTGEYPADMCSQQALKEWHARRLAVFNLTPEYGHLEFIAFETFKRTDEVRAIREVMAIYKWRPVPGAVEPPTGNESQDRKKRKWWISTVWPDDAKDQEIQAMVEALLGNGDTNTPRNSQENNEPSKGHLPTPWAIGINCTGIEKVNRIVQKMETYVAALADSGRWRSEWSSEGTSASSDRAVPAKERPWLVLYPDGAKGLRYDSTARDWIQGDHSGGDKVAWHDALGEIATGIRARGNWAGLILGGCCKTNPEHIRQLRGTIDTVG
jgi:homocysteine S-methyltransferase